MRTSPLSRRLSSLLVIAALSCFISAAGGAAWCAPTPEEATSPQVQKAIEEAVRARVTAIYGEKDDKGLPFKRANYSRSFHRVDDATYRVGLHVDSAMGPDMVTERYLLTLKKGADDEWTIANEELQDTYRGLHRAILGDEDCFHFDKFAYAGEGLKVTASDGSMCKDYFMGKARRYSFASADLAYDYAPPVPKEWTLYHVMKKDKEPDLVFKADFAILWCDPVSCEELVASTFTGLRPIAREETGETMQDAHRKFVKDSEEGLRDNPFFGYRRPYERDRRTHTLSVRRKGAGVDEHWLSLDYDNYEPKEVSLWVSGYGFVGPLYRYYSERTRASGAQPYDLEMRPDSDSRDYDLVSLKGAVEMGFGDGETLVGDVTYGLKTKRALREIPFSIARIFQTEEKKERKNPKLTINSIQDGSQNELTWTRTGVYSGLVVLPEEVPAGTPVTLRLQFENRDSIYKLTSTFSYVDRGGWLPFVRFSDLIDEFDLTVRVPAKYKTLGIGKLVSEVKKDGISTTRWVSDHPVSFPSITYGDYYEDTAGVKATKLDGTVIPVTVHIDKGSLADTYGAAEVVEGYGGQAKLMSYGTWTVSTKVAKEYATIAAQALNLYREVFAVDYPFSKLDLVNDPLGGFYGQSPSSLIYLGNPDFWSGGVTGGLLEAGAQMSTFQDSVVPHEVAHQWWGSLICNANSGNYWFVESLAEYSSALYTESAYGKKKYLEHVEAWRKRVLEADMRGSVQDGYTVWGGPDGFRSYQAALYAKGPYVFHIMRSTWGDEAFFKFLKTLAAELKGKGIVTRDIQRIAEKSFGANLDWFFDQWLRGVGLPQFTFTYSVRQAEDGSQIVEGEVVQRVAMRPATGTKEVLAGQFFKGIIPITVVGKSGKEYRKRLIIEGEKTPFKFNVPEKPKDIVFNKYGESLAYDVQVNTGS